MSDITHAPPRRTRDRVRAVLRSRRLSLRRLDDWALPVARAGLIGLALTGVLVVAQGLGLDGGEFVPERGTIPPLIVAVWLLGLALTALVWTVAVIEQGGWLTTAVRLLVATIGASLGAFLIELPAKVHEAALPGQEVSLSVAPRGGWLVLLLALAPVLVPRRLLARRRRLAGALAASPFLVALGVYLVAGSRLIEISDEFLSFSGNTTWPSELVHRAAVATAVTDTAIVVVFAVHVIVLGQLLEGTRLTRDAALATMRRFEPRWAVVGTVVGAKVLFLVLASVGLVPGSATGKAEGIWDDGALSWLVALGAAIGAVLLVVRRPDPFIDEAGEDRTAILSSLAVFALLAAPFAALGLVFAARHLLGVLPGDLGEAQGEALTNVVVHVAPWLLVIGILAVTVIGAVLVARSSRLRWSAGVLLVAFGVWCAPRALTIAHDLVSYPNAIYPIGDPFDFVERDVQEAGWVNVATIDAFVTVALGALLLSDRARRDREVGARVLFVVLVTGIVTYAGALVPSTFQRGLFFNLGLVFPIAYAFAFDAVGLRRARSPNRAVLVAIGGALLSLTTAMLLIATDDISADSRAFGDFGSQLAKVPLVVPLVVIALRGRLTLPPTDADDAPSST